MDIKTLQKRSRSLILWLTRQILSDPSLFSQKQNLDLKMTQITIPDGIEQDSFILSVRQILQRWLLLINTLILESDSSMEEKITDPNSLDPPPPNLTQPENSDVRRWNYFQASSLIHRPEPRSQTFGTLNSLFLGDLDYRQFPYLRGTEFMYSQAENFGYCDEESPFQVINFNRGTSEMYQPNQVASTGNNQVYAVSLPSKGNQGQRMEQGHQQGLIGSPLSSDLSGQEFKSNSINSPSHIDLHKKQTCTPQAKGILAKNVTKNIGKLLMKFIWKNRLSLKQKVKADDQVWDYFLQSLKQWKRENNITREFLVSRWQGIGEEFKLFRTISHHFFRKHCLAAILRSNIKLKRIHFEQVPKFKQAVASPQALGCLV